MNLDFMENMENLVLSQQDIQNIRKNIDSMLLIINEIKQGDTIIPAQTG